ncbi:MFS transporter [Peribacillus sp. NPDC097895]
MELCSFILCYAFSWAPLTWIIVGEIFPLVHFEIGASKVEYTFVFIIYKS